MAENEKCVCESAVEVPVCGLSLKLDGEALGLLNHEEIQIMVDEAVSAIPVGDSISYSFEEQWTGKYWVDGKKIYQRTFDFGGLPNVTEKKLPIYVPSLNTVVDMKGAAQSSSRYIVLPHVGVATPIALYVGYSATESYISVTSKQNVSNYTQCFITLYYTCTDR